MLPHNRILGMKRKGTIHVSGQEIMAVEIDSEAHAAYLRFSQNKVARTEPRLTVDCVVTMDFDAAGKVVGVELVGVDNFSVGKLLKKAGISGVADTQRVNYVPANLQPA
jgi:uncharacterized protein YuzE